MYLGRAKVHFIRVVIAGFNHPAQDIAQLRLIIDEAQQGLARSTLCADTEDIFRGRIQTDDQEARVEKNDASTQGFENPPGVVVEDAVVTRTATTGGTA